jgi:hypothetical protein
MYWILDLLTTFIHHWELQAITAPLLISTIHKSKQQPLSLFPACCVFNSRSLATVSNSGDSISFPLSRHDCPANIPQLKSLTHQPTTSLHFTELLKVKVKVTLRLAVYRQSVLLGVKLLETHDHKFFQLNLCGISHYVTS